MILLEDTIYRRGVIIVSYKKDRGFTDSYHKTVAVKEIYRWFKWQQLTVSSEIAALKDSEFSIDYEVEDYFGIHIMIQERFRRFKQRKYQDFTLRYERPENEEEVEQKSEFFKMKGKMKRFDNPFYMLYGFESKTDDFCDKFVIIDLRSLFEHYRRGDIIPDSSIYKCKIKDGMLYAAVNDNKDVNEFTGKSYMSSSLICFDIEMLNRLFPEVIKYQRGFIEDSKSIDSIANIAYMRGYRIHDTDKMTKDDIEKLYIFLTDSHKNVQVIHDYLLGKNHMPISEGLIKNYYETETSKIVKKYLL